MRYFHGVTQSTYQRDIYFNRYRAAHQIYGVFYRIFLSHTFGAVQVGLYQLIFPIYALGYSATCAGIQTILSRSVASRLVQGRKKKPVSFSIPDLLITLSVSCCFTIFLQKFAPFLAGSVLGDRRCEHLLILLSYVFLSVLYIAVLPDTASA